jgi:hypothetical protein
MNWGVFWNFWLRVARRRPFRRLATNGAESGWRRFIHQVAAQHKVNKARRQREFDNHCLFVTRSGRPALASVPDTINCRILISEYVHMYIISSRCRHHRGPTAAISIFPWMGISFKAVTHPSTDCPDFCARNRGNRCFNIIRLLALEFGLLRMVRQPSADSHVIWVALHKGATEMGRHNHWKWFDNTNRKWVDSSNKKWFDKKCIFLSKQEMIRHFFCSLEMVRHFFFAHWKWFDTFFLLTGNGSTLFSDNWIIVTVA